MSTVRRRALLLPAAILMMAAACQEGTPVSPSGTTLRISAQPTRIAKNGVAQITLQALRGNGNPVNPGTEIRLSTTVGEVDEVIHTDADGVARAELSGAGQVGTATVTAHSGAVEPVTVDVAIGSLAASVRLQVTPSGVPESGGVLDLLALVRDEQGQPLPDASVNFTSEVGALESGGSFLNTNAAGEARDVLAVAAADLQSVGGTTFEVIVEVGSAGGVVSDTFAVAIQRAPRASFTFQRIDNRVAFTDTSTGNPTSWDWNFGDGNSSTQQNPVHEFAPGDSYIVTLTVRNAVGEDTTNNIVTIPN